MAFERAKIAIKQASIGTGFKVTLAKVRGASAKMKFSISLPVAQKLGWSKGDKLEALIGTDTDHGVMRFRKNNSVGDVEVIYRKAAKGDWVCLSLGHQPMFIDEAQSSAWVQFEEIDDGFVEVVLPKWADKTAPAKTRAPEPIRQVTIAHKPTVNVTSTLMGDPPANRRAMMDKIAEIKP